MPYSPVTDFLALIRLTGGGARTERMPGLDWMVDAMARAGLVNLSVGQTAPTTNQRTTVWLRPSTPSWVAEGTVFLWNSLTAAYEVADPELWAAFWALDSYSFQSVSSASGVINTGTTVLAIQRSAPTATALVLPNLNAQRANGGSIKIADWSSAVTSHVITLTTPDASTIMRLASFDLLSTADQLAGATLTPVPEINGWIIA